MYKRQPLGHANIVVAVAAGVLEVLVALVVHGVCVLGNICLLYTSQAGTDAAGHLLFHAHKAGGAFFGTQAGGIAHHDGGAAHQHHVVVRRVVQMCIRDSSLGGIVPRFYDICKFMHYFLFYVHSSKS